MKNETIRTPAWTLAAEIILDAAETIPDVDNALEWAASEWPYLHAKWVGRIEQLYPSTSRAKTFAFRLTVRLDNEPLQCSDIAMSKRTLDREALGKIAYEAYRVSLNRTTDDTLRPWDEMDHETQLAFRDVGEAVAWNILDPIP